MKLHLRTYRIVSSFTMLALFYLIVTPLGIMIRLMGRDPLDLKFDTRAQSYWIDRKQLSWRPESMKRQYR